MKILKNTTDIPVRQAGVADATVILPNDLITLDDNGLMIKAIATSEANGIGYALGGSVAGSTEPVSFISDERLKFMINGSAVFAATMRGEVHDIVVDGGEQKLNVAASATGVLAVDTDPAYGVVGSATDIVVRIAKTIK